MSGGTRHRPQMLRPSARGILPAHALPVNHRFDLTEFLLPEALDDGATERWIARQQLPRQVRGLGLESVLHDVLRRRWQAMLAHLSAGLNVVELDDRRRVDISNVLFFEVFHESQELAAGAVDGNCLRWFDFNVVRPFPGMALIGRLQRSEEPHELDIPAHLLRQPLPEPRDEDPWKLYDLQYFARHAFAYAGYCIRRRMRRAFRYRPFNELLCRALALSPDDVIAVLRARPARPERYALSSFFWNHCMQHREKLRAVAAARPLLLPMFGAMAKADILLKSESPESLLAQFSVYPANLRIRYQRYPPK